VLHQPLGDGAELCALEPWQAAEFAAHVDRVRAHLAPWVPFAHSVTDTDSARGLLQRMADAQARDAGRFYGIRVDGELGGGTLFRTFDAAAGVCEVGAWIAPEHQGRGLVRRAVTHMITWAVGPRGLSRVEWRTDPRNERSRAVARALGFTLEGTLRSNFALAGERRDTDVWAMLAGEWTGADAGRSAE
jgi:RimJ/RimL family protein N-acetyltransferase